MPTVGNVILPLLILSTCFRFVLDGKHEQGIPIERLTTIPMPHRGEQATLRDRPSKAGPLANSVPKSVYARMSAIDLLKRGLLYKRNVKKGWLIDLLIGEKILEDNKAAKNKRVWDDYQVQQLFIQGMQAALGDEFDPRASKQGRSENGDFAANKNGVPQNFLTMKYLLHAYDFSYTSFKRMKASSCFIVEKKSTKINKSPSSRIKNLQLDFTPLTGCISSKNGRSGWKLMKEETPTLKGKR